MLSYQTKQKGIRDGMHADLQHATPLLATIAAGAQDNNTRAPRARGSDDRGLYRALPTRVAERCATRTSFVGLRHEAVINSGPYTRATASITRQRVTGLSPDRTPATMGLLHAVRQQGIVTTPHRAGIHCVGGFTRE